MSAMEHLPVYFVIVPLFAALFIPILAKLDRGFGWVGAALGTAAGFIMSLAMLHRVRCEGPVTYWMSNWEPPYGISYHIDALNAFVLVIITGAAFIMALYAKRSVEKEIDEEKHGLFYSVFMLNVTGMSGIVVTGDAFNLYVLLEITALSSYALIAMGRRQRACVAALHYLMLGTIGATFYLIGLGYLYLVTGTLNIIDLQAKIHEFGINEPAIRTGFIFILVGLAIKLAVFPLHTWQPGSYGEAPSAVSGLLASTGTKVAAYVLIRVTYSIMLPGFSFAAIPLEKILLYAGVLSMIAGSVLAFNQTDIKRMLAYSSMGQIGYIVMGMGLASERALTGSLIHMLNHAVMKGVLFMAVGAVAWKIGSTKISDYKGIGAKMPLTGFAFVLGACAMIGVPGTVGFIGKWYLATAALQAGQGWIVAALLLSSLMGAVYFGRIIIAMFFSGEREQERAEAPAGMVLTTLGAAALCVVFGIFSSPTIGMARAAVSTMLGVE